MRVDGDATQRGVALLVDYGGDVGDDAYVVLPDNAQGGSELCAELARPFCANFAVWVFTYKVRNVFAVGTVNLDCTVACDEAFDAIAKNRVAAFCEFIVDAFHIIADDQHIIRLFFLCAG